LWWATAAQPSTMKTTSIHIDDLPVDERTREVLATSMMK
jgi:hypothetical protein